LLENGRWASTVSGLMPMTSVSVSEKSWQLSRNACASLVQDMVKSFG
jgi:hypothetical protein